MRYIPWQSLFTSKQSKVMDPVYKPSSIIYSMYRNQGIQRIKDKLSIGASFSQVRKETRETDKHINVYKDRQKRNITQLPIFDKRSKRCAQKYFMIFLRLK